MMRVIGSLMAVALLLGAGSAPPRQESVYHEAFRRLHEAGQFNGAVLIAVGDSVVLDAQFGTADVTTQRPLTDRSLYRLASVSKVFTATALLTLVEADRVALDAPVQRYLPTFPYPAVTVRHLLQHSAGLPEYIFGVGDARDDARGPMTNRDVLQWLIDTHPELAFPPGQGWDYCNTGFALVPLIVEAVTGESYPGYLRRAVFAPAGMHDSYHLAELGVTLRDRVAAGHGFDYATGVDVRVDRHPVLAAEFNTDSVFGAGDVVSTARDLFRFDQALKAGRILSTSSQADAYTSLILPEGFPAGYGLGWQVAESEYTGRIIHHHGQGDGYRTRYYRFLDRGITIVTLQNARERYADDAVRMAQQLAFKGTYTLPAHSLAEALGGELHDHGLEAGLQLVDSAVAAPGSWAFDERDLRNVALTYWFQGQREMALALFTSYLRLLPDEPGVYMSLAEALEEAGRTDEARTRYREALEVARKDPRAHARQIATLKKLLGDGG
ncbi:MAG: serine hydrolase [Gemmatimonadales bacterium]|nr:serine hydrolase [Gemmatimonadales bacterium]